MSWAMGQGSYYPGAQTPQGVTAPSPQGPRDSPVTREPHPSQSPTSRWGCCLWGPSYAGPRNLWGDMWAGCSHSPSPQPSPALSLLPCPRAAGETPAPAPPWPFMLPWPFPAAPIGCCFPAARPHPSGGCISVGEIGPSAIGVQRALGPWWGRVPESGETRPWGRPFQLLPWAVPAGGDTGPGHESV